VQLPTTARLLPLLAPVHLLVLSVIVLPSLYVVWLSLNMSSFGQAPSFVGLQNYIRVLSDPAFHRAVLNTVVLVVVAVHLELAIGLGMALLFASGLPFRRFLLVAVLAPYAVSEVTAVVMWRFLFDPDAGPITLALRALSLPSLDWSFEPSHAMTLIGLLTVWLHLPFTFVIVYAARLAIPAELYEAGKDRRRDALAGFSARDAAAACARDADRAAVPLHLRLPPVLGSLAADEGRAGALDRGRGDLSLSGGLQLQRLRLGGRDRLDHGRDLAGLLAGAYVCPAQAREALMRTERILIGAGEGGRGRRDPALVAVPDPVHRSVVAEARGRTSSRCRRNGSSPRR
jgi:ABC-type spermidine/putrescine transport system permease subunit II